MTRAFELKTQQGDGREHVAIYNAPADDRPLEEITLGELVLSTELTARAFVERASTKGPIRNE